MPINDEQYAIKSAGEETAVAVVPKHPELLMAAREGDPARLNVLLNVPAVAWTAINIEEEVDGHSPYEADTSGLDSILHLVASGGDSADFLESARVIHSKARHLLDAGNSDGDTPLHCAARAGRIGMVSQLINLARDEAGDERVKAVLRKQNWQLETVLHEALRLGDKQMVKAMVDMLMSADPQLARLPMVDGSSPLYLAVSLGHTDIAEQLHDKDQGLSYCGPDGQNVMHAAVLHKNTWMTDMLIKWGKHNLITQGDRLHGNTPLHLAASRGVRGTVISLLNADRSSAYQLDDNKGSLPIHVAAMVNRANVVCLFLDKCPGCAEARDTEGRTFLHVAIDNMNFSLVWTVFLHFNWRQQVEWFEAIINMRDRDGNTGLHLAVQAGRVESFYCLLWNKGVQLNLRNNMGKTALDLVTMELGSLHAWMDTGVLMRSLLEAAGAEYGAHHQYGLRHLDEKKEAKMISDSIQTIGVISALLFTVSFAAAFAIPGGYRAGDDPKAGAPVAGTPVLTTSYSFQGFVIANNLALLCSALSTICLAYAGVTNFGIRTRLHAFILSIFFLHSSARSLAAAFAFGTEAALAPVARATAVVTWLGMAFSYIDVVWLAITLALAKLVLLKRQGIGASLRVAVMILIISIWAFWPYVIILSLLAYYKTHGIH